MTDNDVTFAVKCFFRSVYSVGVFLSISVSVQVAQGLTVRELDLGGVVDWRADELKHRFLHVCGDEIQHTRFHYSPAGTTGGTSAAYFAFVCSWCSLLCYLLSVLWKVSVTDSSHWHWKKARPTGVMLSWCCL